MSVVALWRYPVKSMMGEELNALTVNEHGVVGDRAYAIVDPDTGKVGSAKHPKKWPNLFDCRAAFVEPPRAGEALPPVQVMLPDGGLARSDDPGSLDTLAAMLGRPGRLQAAVPERPVLEEYWPDLEELDLRDTVTDESMPTGTFFDCATIHMLTTGTLDRLRGLYPEGRFEMRRFRPNIVIGTPPNPDLFPEASWVGRTIAIGAELRVKITTACPRCVMTTLPQGDLPRDPGILRTAARHNDATVGVYGEIVRPGAVRRGDTVSVV